LRSGDRAAGRFSGADCSGQQKVAGEIEQRDALLKFQPKANKSACSRGMRLRLDGTAFFSRFGCAAHYARRACLSWYETNKDVWALALAFSLMATIFGLAVRADFADRERMENLARQYHERHLECLARNVYYEARGEPVAGQYAVAEVTMNRTASGRYPDTVCEVVYQRNWDPVRRRYVGAFSWTEFSGLEEPSGEEWQRAWNIAEAVYYQKQLPSVQGALFFHATYVKPEWTKDKQRVARIGRHIFYR